MSFNVDEFRTYVSSQNEFSLASRFQVELAVPLVLRNDGFGANLTLSCAQAELPGVDITPAEFRHYGFIQRVPWHINFAPVTLTFLCTGKMVEKKFFDSWMSTLIPFNTGLVEYPIQASGQLMMTTDIKIRQFNNIGNSSVTGDVPKPTKGNKDPQTKPPSTPSTLANETGIYTVTLKDAMPVSMQSLQLDWSNENIHHLSVTFVYKRWLSDQTTTAPDPLTPSGVTLKDPSVTKQTAPTTPPVNNASNDSTPPGAR